jgi:hypothetical protein
VSTHAAEVVATSAVATIEHPFPATEKAVVAGDPPEALRGTVVPAVPFVTTVMTRGDGARRVITRELIAVTSKA